MSGINPQVIYSVSQIKTTFTDSIGNIRTGVGTGFFLRTNAEGKVVYITNRHNLDASLRLGAEWLLKSVSILLRRYDGTAPCSETRFIEVDIKSTLVRHAENADVSILFAPVFVGRSPEYGWQALNFSSLASEEFFYSKVKIMDFVSFIGFPGNSSGSKWWDQAWNLPIARLATLASIPYQSFSNSEIITTDVCLVSGMSFSGSSGSPVFLHEKGVRPGGVVVDPSYVPATIIGIMSGHWQEAASESEMFKHTGLSYFTRATSIVDLLSVIETEQRLVSARSETGGISVL